MTALLTSDPQLYEVPDWIEESPLVVAIQGDQVKAVRLLLQRGASPDQDCECRATIHWAAGVAGPRKSAWVTCHTVLQLAVHAVNREIVSRLLEAGADVNRLGNIDDSVLEEPVFNPQGTKEDAVLGDLKGMTAVHHAILKDDQDLKEVLVWHGAKLSPRTNGLGLTALHWAVATSEPALVRRALAAGIDPHFRTPHDETAIEVALRIKFHAGEELIMEELKKRDEIQKREQEKWGAPYFFS